MLFFKGVDEAATITLLYSNQRFATINVSTNCAMFGPTFIAGDKGVIQVNNKNNKRLILKLFFFWFIENFYKTMISFKKF